VQAASCDSDFLRYNLEMHVLLFDIDGTLIHSGGAGHDALRAALEDEFGVLAKHHVEVHGRTDRSIASDLFTAHEIENSEQNWCRFRDAYLRRLPQLVPKKQGRVLPGVSKLLDVLSQRQDVALGLLTGNVREGARIKLEHFALFHHFRFGGFGDLHHERDDVAREALESARQHLDGSFQQDRVWVIGDTPRDIQCARAITARVLVVATGFCSHEELLAANPDVLVDDLSDSASLVKLLC